MSDHSNHAYPYPYPYPPNAYGGYPPPPSSAAPPYHDPYSSYPSDQLPPQPYLHHSQYPPPPQSYPPPPQPYAPPPYGSNYPMYSPSFHHDSPSPSPSASFNSSSHPPVDAFSHLHLSDTPVPPYPAPLQHGGGSHHGSAQQSLQIVPVVTGERPYVMPSLKVVLLHGSLDIVIFDAKNLPNKDMFSKTIGEVFGQKLDKKMTSDPYVTVSLCTAVIARTYVVSNDENPVWNQHFNVPVAHEVAEVEFTVKDNDVFGAQLIGTVSIPTEKILSGERIEGIYRILLNGKQCNPGAVLRLSIMYTSADRLTMYHLGVTVGPTSNGVPNTYFPLRKQCKVTLYQDAHVPYGSLPSFRLENGVHYQHGTCWYDVYNAIKDARRLVYITGWSVFHTITLLRDPGVESPTLGELLKSKSQEGVRVLLLVWDDPTSRNILGYHTDGFMGTKDEETRRFFKHSSVQVLLCPRSAGKRHSWVKQQETGTIFTHHQKTVIVDADAGNYRRKIVAFVGGLDLCGGRYDTPAHPILRSLQTVHKDDYHNPNFAVSDTHGPREPWHDLHSRIDGPASYDVLTNFEERWLKASKRHGIRKFGKSNDDALLKLDRLPEILSISESASLSDSDPETWHVQIFRSIDSNSAKGFPKDPTTATSKNLVCGKNVLIDMSIHTAYVNAIRAAQHYIYIENQYFLGSSFSWDSHKDLGANNLIPIEIALKIVNKIKAKERFSAYIVLPMWPEGAPTGAATQNILYWQNKTMQMMYETIYRALNQVGLDDIYEPQDYLNFFCLGNREAADPYSPPEGSPKATNTPQEMARKNRRFMIYVHSKGMIVDDEYVIIGSANINQRSLEGTRDTEIAMGAYQPEYTWARKLCAPRGQIYGYRMSLWAEHMGTVEDIFNYPESIECMRRVRDLSELHWRQFASPEITEMNGHLLKYPVSVDRKGKVKPLPGCPTFPDIGGNICGSFIGVQENLTI